MRRSHFSQEMEDFTCPWSARVEMSSGQGMFGAGAQERGSPVCNPDLVAGADSGGTGGTGGHLLG